MYKISTTQKARPDPLTPRRQLDEGQELAEVLNPFLAKHNLKIEETNQ